MDILYQQSFIQQARLQSDINKTMSIPNYQSCNSKIRLIYAFLKNQTYNSTLDVEINNNIDIQGIYTNVVSFNATHEIYLLSFGSFI
jgi:hypothetical protein